MAENDSALWRSAQAYISRGIAVVPIPKAGYQWGNGQVASGKGPILKDWQNRRLPVAELERQIKLGNGNIGAIGVLTGAISGNLAILDFDLDGWPQAFDYLLECWPELRNAPIVKTGSGKRHVWFKCTEMPHDFTHHEYERPDLNAKIDLRGNQCQALAPPSLHPSGQYYEWLTEKAELIDIPYESMTEWLRNWAGIPPDDTPPPSTSRTLPNATQFIAEGNRNERLASMAGSMRRAGFEQTAIEVALLDTNRLRCQPPLPPDEVKSIARSIARYAAPGQTEGEQRQRIVIHTAADALLPQPPMEWIVDQLNTPGAVSIVVGEAGSKKTYSMLDKSVCIALGEPWLGMPVKQRNVLILDEESGTRRLTRRLGDVMRGHSAGRDTPISYVSLAGFNLMAVEEQCRVHALIQQTQAGYVLIDALADVMPGGDENAVKDVLPVFLGLRQMADVLHCSIEVIHHLNKMGGYRGSTAIKGAVDVMVMVESKNDSSNVTFKIDKSRDGQPKDFAAIAYFEPDRMWLAPATLLQVSHFAKSEEFVLRWLKARDQASVQDMMDHADVCSPGTCRNAVYSLANKGLIRRCNGGNQGNAAVYELTLRGRQCTILGS